MQKFQSLILYGITLTAGILISASALLPQPRAGGPGWQYCTVTDTSYIQPVRANICYATPSGCKNESVTAPDSRTDAEVAAAQKLGDQGWELIAATHSDNHGETLYFKRLKALDNQHPLGN